MAVLRLSDTLTIVPEAACDDEIVPKAANDIYIFAVFSCMGYSMKKNRPIAEKGKRTEI
jgi:hypothetical protein